MAVGLLAIVPSTAVVGAVHATGRAWPLLVSVWREKATSRHEVVQLSVGHSTVVGSELSLRFQRVVEAPSAVAAG